MNPLPPHWRVVFDRRGGHTHVTFWTGREGQRAKCGTIIVDNVDGKTLERHLADLPGFTVESLSLAGPESRP